MRALYEITYTISPITVDQTFADDPAAWLKTKAGEYSLDLLLAFADDGLIWGRYEASSKKLHLSCHHYPVVSPGLSAATIQEVRLFGPAAELLLWRTGPKAWQARLLDDQGRDETATSIAGWAFDEAQLQWGDRLASNDERTWAAEGSTAAVAESSAAFTLVAEGQEGLYHAVPLPLTPAHFDKAEKERERWRPLSLGVRHYLACDGDGQWIIDQGRLTSLTATFSQRKEQINGEPTAP